MAVFVWAAPASVLFWSSSRCNLLRCTALVRGKIMLQKSAICVRSWRRRKVPAGWNHVVAVATAQGQAVPAMGTMLHARTRDVEVVRFGSSQSTSLSNAEGSNQRKRNVSKLKDDGLTLSHFIASSSAATNDGVDESIDATSITASSSTPMAADIGDEFYDEQDLMVTDAMSCSTSPSTPNSTLNRLGQQMVNDNDAGYTEEKSSFHSLKFHIKTYGCQMNVNDTDIVRSILLNNHINQQAPDATTPADVSIPLRFIETDDEIQADVLLTNTCAIRENAEQKVWNRLRELRSHDRNFPLSSVVKSDGCISNEPFATTKEQRKQLQQKHTKGQKNKKRIIGVLGCMAERLKEDMFKDGTADVVVGPDAYRDLPRLISVLAAPSVGAHGNSGGKSSAPSIPTERAVNVQLSLDETYASITPIRSNPEDVSAFVSIMRGCNNMCSYCVVPFTRGRERSRELESVVEETKRLLEEEGIKEVILLGQNVNSYHDVRGERRRGKMARDDGSTTYQTSNDGFSNMFRLRHGDGYRFADLLEAVSDLSPELRVRFTSPHPKDYPPPLLSLMAERSNICNHLHMPAQSGSSSVLERMRRGYTREAYLELIDDVRGLIPEVAISSDFITGFCGETEDEHKETLSLMEKVQFDQAFMFAYSMREKTHAHRTMEDDVPADVKNRRLNEVIDCFRRNVQLRNDAMEVGKLRLVLVEGEAKRSTADNRMWSGRTDENKRVVFASESCFVQEEVTPFLSQMVSLNAFGRDGIINANEANLQTKVGLSRGDYAVVLITEARGHTLKGQALWRSSIQGFEHLMSMKGWEDSSDAFVGKLLTQTQ